MIGTGISEPVAIVVFGKNLTWEEGVADEEKAIQCGADDRYVEAGRGRCSRRGGDPEGGDQRADILSLDG
jgi:hypothetical protein